MKEEFTIKTNYPRLVILSKVFFYLSILMCICGLVLCLTNIQGNQLVALIYLLAGAFWGLIFFTTSEVISFLLDREYSEQLIFELLNRKLEEEL